MRVVFRADASARMGTGHVMRCISLAETLRARGAETRFVCREHPGNLVATLEGKNLPVSLLPAPDASVNINLAVGREDHAAWLGVSQAVDAQQTIDALRGQALDWLVVDHYSLGVEWEERLRPHAGRLMVIDDLADRIHDCDVLLDQNYVANGVNRHAGLVPYECRLLLGPRYALLAPEYAQARKILRARDGRVRRVLVYFGGSDPRNTTGQALEALSAAEFSHLEVDVVVGMNHAHRTPLEAQAAVRARTHLHGPRPHLADLMAEADLAVGAGGIATWERMCLGLPSVVVSIAENQRPTCEALASDGLIEYVGDAATVDGAAIGSTLRSLLADGERLRELSRRAARLVDGEGVTRVADAMGRGAEAGSDGRLRTRHALHQSDTCPAGFDHFGFAWIDRCDPSRVLALRNMPHVTSRMRTPGAIAAADHRAFIAKYEHLDRYDFVLIDESRQQYVGAFYVTHLRVSPELGKYIGPVEYQGQGIAHRAVLSLLEYCRGKAGIGELTAITQPDNAPNIALNSRLGFTRVGHTADGYVVMRMEL